MNIPPIFLPFILARGIKEHQSEQAKQDLAKKAALNRWIPRAFPAGKNMTPNTRWKMFFLFDKEKSSSESKIWWV